jgi:hypothetical protein
MFFSLTCGGERFGAGQRQLMPDARPAAIIPMLKRSPLAGEGGEARKERGEVRNEKGEARSEKGERKREKGDALSNHAAVCLRNIQLSTGGTDIPDDIQIGIGIHSHASFTFIHIHTIVWPFFKVAKSEQFQCETA